MEKERKKNLFTVCNNLSAHYFFKAIGVGRTKVVVFQVKPIVSRINNF